LDPDPGLSQDDQEVIRTSVFLRGISIQTDLTAFPFRRAIIIPDEVAAIHRKDWRATIRFLRDRARDAPPEEAFQAAILAIGLEEGPEFAAVLLIGGKRNRDKFIQRIGSFLHR
jgi:hypothetical protein